MRWSVPATLALLCSALGGAAFAQDEPPLFETPGSAQAAPSATPAPILPSTPPADARGPLPPALDFTRWQVMTARERQTYVEGSLASVASLTARLRMDVVSDKTLPRDGLTSVVRFVNLNSPRRAPMAYLKEMERLYMTAEGQKLSMADCFHRAFERLNTPAAVTPAAAAKPAGEKPADQ